MDMDQAVFIKVLDGGHAHFFVATLAIANRLDDLAPAAGLDVELITQAEAESGEGVNEDAIPAALAFIEGGAKGICDIGGRGNGLAIIAGITGLDEDDSSSSS